MEMEIEMKTTMTKGTTLKTLRKRNILYTIHPEVKSYALPKKEFSSWEKVMTEYTNRFIREVFGDVKPIDVKVNNKLRATEGWFVHSRNSYVIEISGKVLTTVMLLGETREPLACLEDILRHEAIHYALWSLNKPYDDGDLEFEQMLYYTNTTPSGNTKSSLCYKTKSDALVSRYLGRCPKCSKTSTHDVRGSYRCGACYNKGHLAVVKPKEIIVGIGKDVKIGGKDIEKDIHNQTRGTFAGVAPIKRRA